MKLHAVVLSLSLLFVACKSKDKTAGPGSAPPQAGPAGPAPGTGTKASNALASAVTLTCEQAARDVKGDEATAWYMTCPACEDLSGNVWGTDLYTDDSNICASAVHAGAIKKTGGLVLVTWVPGQPTYIGSTRNGIDTSDYGEWHRSFFVQSVDANGVPTSPVVKPAPAGTIQLSCKMTLATLETKPGGSVHVMCPAGCTTGDVWGTDVYTGDSTLCVAAVHAGAVSADKGGEATVQLGGPQGKFDGTPRNGVTSASFESFPTSFTFTKK